MEKRLLIILIVLGVFLRLFNYGSEGIGSIDAPQTIAQGLLFFYPHDYYPGLLMGQPSLGHFFIGLGCILSGEDFSAVSNAPQISSSQAVLFDPSIERPYVAPGIISDLGGKIVKAGKFCLLPVYLFGIVFFVFASLLSVGILGYKKSLYPVAFLAFNPFILFESRYLHVDVILYAIVALGLYFLWQGYSLDEGYKKFQVAFALFGLAASTKFHAAAFIVFALFIYFEKRRSIDAGALKLIFLYIIAFLLPFGFNPRNVVDVYKAYAANVPPAVYSPTLGIGFLKSLYSIFWYMNALDYIVIIAAFYGWYRSFRSEIGRADRFTLYYASFYFVVGALFGGAIGPLYLAFPFLIWVPFIFSKGLGAFGRYVPLFMGIYIVLSFVSSIYASPYYQLNANPLLSSRADYYQYSNVGEASNTIAEALAILVGENETFFMNSFNTASVHLYFRPEEYKAKSHFAEAFYKENGRPPVMEEFIELYNSAGRWIRYVVIIPDVQYAASTGEGRDVRFVGKAVSPFEAFLTDSCKPFELVTLKGRVVAEIYDIANLNCRGT